MCVCLGGGGGGGGDALQPKGGGGGVWGKSIATGLGREPVGGCYSAEMRRPAIRSTAHDPILSYPTYQPPIQDVSLQISVPNCVPLRGYTIITWCALNVVIIWIELQVRVSFMKWTIIVDFKRYKDLSVDLMDPVTTIQTGLYHSFYEHIIIINMVKWQDTLYTGRTIPDISIDRVVFYQMDTCYMVGSRTIWTFHKWAKWLYPFTTFVTSFTIHIDWNWWA